VLKAPDIPSALIETAFISNPEEEARLNDDAYQEKLAGAIVRGIRQYFIRHPPGPKARLAASADSEQLDLALGDFLGLQFAARDQALVAVHRLRPWRLA
jgi:hypothetical protein